MSQKYLAVKNLQYVLSTVKLFVVLGFYGGLTSWFYSLSESLAVGCIQHLLLHLTPPNMYVAKAQLHCPPHPPKKPSSQRRCVKHVVSDILCGLTIDLKLTFLSVTNTYVRMYIVRIDPSLKASR